jgi:hypothetical protein
VERTSRKSVFLFASATMSSLNGMCDPFHVETLAAGRSGQEPEVVDKSVSRFRLTRQGSAEKRDPARLRN